MLQYRQLLAVADAPRLPLQVQLWSNSIAVACKLETYPKLDFVLLNGRPTCFTTSALSGRVGSTKGTRIRSLAQHAHCLPWSGGKVVLVGCCLLEHDLKHQGTRELSAHIARWEHILHEGGAILMVHSPNMLRSLRWTASVPPSEMESSKLRRLTPTLIV